MQKLSAYNLAQNNNCGLITCSICGRSYRITEFGTDADCQSNSPSASNPNFCPYCASPFERPLTRVRNQEIEDYILDTIRIGMKSDTVLDPETVIDFLCNISDGGFELYDPKFEIYFNSGITYGADNLECLASFLSFSGCNSCSVFKRIDLIFYQFPHCDAFANSPLHVPFHQSHTSCQTTTFQPEELQTEKSPAFYGEDECENRIKPVVLLVHIVHLKQFQP